MDEHEIREEFMTRLRKEEARQGITRPNVVVCGYIGSGKTSLIQAICGDLVPDEAIGSANATTMGFDEYANEHIAVWDSKGLQPGDNEDGFLEIMRQFIDRRREEPGPAGHIHLVWYTIQGPGARITDYDIRLIRDVFLPEHLIVVLTKADITRPEQIEALRERLIEIGVPGERIVATSDRKSGSAGCRELMELTQAMLPAACRDAFVEAQRVDRQARLRQVKQKRARAKAVVAGAVAAATGIGATPIPVADAGLLIPTQMAMIVRLAVLYGLDRDAVHHALLPFVARIVGVYTASSLLRLFPGLGSVINATVAGTLTGALGWYTLECFEEMAIARITGAPIPEPVFDIETFRFWCQNREKSR